MRALASFALCLGLATPVLGAQTYGLVIGIDDYEVVSDLQGAVNDARDIADALLGLDAKVTMLLNRDATRAAILQTWQGILATAQPGDTLIVSYAGHGSNEPEHTPGNEEDGLDENFLLAGFSPYGAASGERIRDDEIADLIAKRPDIEVIFVADACHSGTVTRNLNPTLGYRYVTPTSIEGDPLPPPPPRPSDTLSENNVTLFLAAVNETEKVPEFLIDGEARGALSYAFAQGLRGHADGNNDGVLTKGELETFIRQTVRQVSDGVQLPQSYPVGAIDTALLTLQTSTPALTDIRDLPFADLPPISIATDATLPPLTDAFPVDPQSLAEARFDITTGTVTSMVGDVIAAIETPGDLGPIAQKFKLAEALRTVATSPLSVRFLEGNKSYAANDIITVSVSNRETNTLSLLNINAQGEITHLYPQPAAGDPMTLSARSAFRLPLRIAPPFGADHVVAFDGGTPRHHANLKSLDGTKDIAALWDIIRQAPELGVAVFPFFSVTTE